MSAVAEEKKIVVGGSFLIEERTTEEVFTPEDFTEEHRMIADTARQFMDGEVRPRIDDLEKKDWKLARELVQKGAELGFIGATVPEEYGGLGLDQVSGAIIGEYLGRSASFATTMGAQGGIGLLPILYYGTEEAKRKYLPKIITDQNVYKCNAGMNNIYSSLDRGDETVADGVNLRLPSGSSNGKGWGNLDFDVKLMLADKAWDANGQLNMDNIAFDGFLGDQMTVNFAWKPFFNVYARRYRFRILNASVSRFFVLALSDSSQFVQIANDGNLLPVTVPLKQTDQLGIAERYDIVIDFSRYSAGQTVDLVNLQVHQDGREPANIVTVAQALAGTSDPAVGAFLRFKVLGPPPHPDQSVNLTANPRTALSPNPILPTTARFRTFRFDDSGSQNQNDPVTTYLGNGQGVFRWGIETDNNGGSSSIINSDTGGTLEA